MTAKHTPGPWAYVEARTEGFCILPMPGLNNVVRSEDEDGHFGPISSEADAKLIAAAPELLEALEGLLARYIQCIGNEGIECYKAIAAIKKAAE